MRTQTRTLAICLCGCIALTQLFSCKKEATIQESINSSSVDDAKASLKIAAWYKFTKGSTVDYSGNGNNLTSYNITTTTDAAGHANNAILLDGFSSYLTTFDSPSLNPKSITIAALVKPISFNPGAGGHSRILMKGDDDQSSGAYFLGFSGSGSYYGTYGDGQFASAGAASADGTVKLNSWTKLIYTYDGATAKLYVNNVLVSSTSFVATFTPSGQMLRIGTTGRWDYPYWFNGAIDEIRIYNGAASFTDVKNISNQLTQD